MEIDFLIWEQVQKQFKVGDSIACVVTSHQPFGLLVEIEEPPIWGVIERIGMSKQGYVTPEEYPPVGSKICGILLGFREKSRQLELKLTGKSTFTSDQSQDECI